METLEPTGRCLSPEEAKRFYDRLGSMQDWQKFYENHAINDLIAHAAFESARSIFEFGCGTGSFAVRLLQRYLSTDASYAGLDISSTMIALARKRLEPWSGRARVHQSDASPRVPEPDQTLDRFVSIYVFDLLAPNFIEQLLSEAHRLLVPGGKLCLASLTFGASGLSRAVGWGWQRLWRINPGIVGGCRPIELLDYLVSENWNCDHRAVLTSWGITSEVLVASPKCHADSTRR